MRTLFKRRGASLEAKSGGGESGLGCMVMIGGGRI